MPARTKSGSASDNLRSAIEVSDVALRLRPFATTPRGIARFHSIEDAQEHRRQWERAGLTA
jgi:hypothetical protein